MIDPRLPEASGPTSGFPSVDWGNAYLGPSSRGGLVVWPPELESSTGAQVLQPVGWGIVLTPNEALRESPAHVASLLSEVWMGEFVQVLLEEDGWWLVAGEDGYVGWMRAWASRFCEEGEREDLVSRRSAVFTAATGWLIAPDGARSPLMGGSPLLEAGTGSDGQEFELVDASRGCLEEALLEREAPRGSSVELVGYGRSLLGASYRWGGRGPGGIDCSGLVQWAALRAGFQLPRDAVQQSVLGEARSLAAEDWRQGDLLFFHEPVDHVGIYAGEDRMIHARARVREQPLHELSDLMGELVGVRRLGSAEHIRQETLWRRIPRSDRS